MPPIGPIAPGIGIGTGAEPGPPMPPIGAGGPARYGVGNRPCGGGACSTVPQLRQNRIDGGFSVRHVEHSTGNPPPPAGVCGAYAAAGATSADPQWRQKLEPPGLS